MTAIAVKNLSRNFGGVSALDDVSLDIQSGERRAIIGTNGAGKTTLFNILNGQIPASAGEIWLFGRNVTRLPTHRRAQLGLARTFQITSLLPHLTVFENVIVAVQAFTPCRLVFYRTLARHRDLLARSQELLEQWHLWDVRDELAKNLSYGVQRQLEIVMALAGRPRLLLLDEPMAGLSAAETTRAADSIIALDRSITILLIEHDLPTAYRIADRVTALDRGRIVADGSPAEIRKESVLRKIFERGGSVQPGSGP